MRCSFRMLCALTGLVFTACIGPAARAQDKEREIVVGRSIEIESTTLGEKRTILVSLPDGYERSGEGYPVLYVLDGEAHFVHATGIVRFLAAAQRIPPMIVVGIVNTDRTRDFTPMHVASMPVTGGAGKFLRYLQDEVMPRIEQKYHTMPFRVLMGHSYGGLFAAYTLLAHENAFTGYIAIAPAEPAAYTDGNARGGFLVGLASKRQEQEARTKRMVFITTGSLDYQAYVHTGKDLADTLSRKFKKEMLVQYTSMEEEDHASIVHRALYDALETMYQGLRVPATVAEQGSEAVLAYYEEQSALLGFEGTIREEWINGTGYGLLQRGQVSQAIDIFGLNLRLHPDSPNVYDSMGEALERSGQMAKAREQYAMACKKAEELKDPNLQVFKANLERAVKVLESR